MPIKVHEQHEAISAALFCWARNRLQSLLKSLVVFLKHKQLFVDIADNNYMFEIGEVSKISN